LANYLGPVEPVAYNHDFRDRRIGVVWESHVVTKVIEGTIVAIDDAGNLVSDIPASRLDGVPADESTTVTCDEHETCGWFSVDHDQPDMTLIALVGRSGFLELSLVGDSAHLMLGVPVGEKIVVRW
jgi:S-adenosylmethionine hydrolase